MIDQDGKQPTCETCYWFDDYVCERLNCSVKLADQVCWNYRPLWREVANNENQDNRN